MRRAWVAAGLVVGVAAACGCAPVAGGFRADGFHEADLPVSVRFTDPASRSFVGPDWRVDNFLLKKDGSFGDAKTAEGYLYNREIDVDGDGRPETKESLVYDLKLINRVTTSAIWMQTVLLAMADKDRSLTSFLDDFVEALSGTGLYRAGAPVPRLVGRTKSYGARLVASKEGTTGGFPSLDATIELVNLDQLKVDPNAKSSIGRVVFVRTDYPHAFRQGDNRYETRAMVVLGCESVPRDFDATNADFDKFVQGVQLGPAVPLPALPPPRPGVH
jgi:hypothetical protein